MAAHSRADAKHRRICGGNMNNRGRWDGQLYRGWGVV